MGKETVYVNKKFVFRAREVKEKCKAVSQYGEMSMFPGEICLTDLYGNEMPETKELFDEHYIPLNVDEEKLSLYEKMARGYQEMGDINLEEAEAGKHTYSDGLEDL